MPVVLGWRVMTPVWCATCGGVTLEGIRGHSHLPQRLSYPAVCLGYVEHIAHTHLQHDPEWKPPQEHIAANSSLTAQCYYCFWGICQHIKELLHGTPHHLPPAPHPYCTCGYYILWRPQDQSSVGVDVLGGRVWLYVVGVGRYVAYTEGARLERYRLLRWWWPLTEWQGEWQPVDARARSRVYATEAALWWRGTALDWHDVVEALKLRYALPPVVGDPREADLPSGVLQQLPDVVESML